MHSLFSFFFPPSSHLRHQLGFELLDPCKLFLHLARELNLGHGPRLECLLQPFHLIELLEIIKMDVRWRRVNKHGKQVTVIVRGLLGSTQFKFKVQLALGDLEAWCMVTSTASVKLYPGFSLDSL